MVNKIKVLFLAANPVDSGYRLRLDEEIREIDQRIQVGTNRECFELISHFAVRPGDLQGALLRHKPHIVHFSGHGSKTQGIILEDKDANMKPVSKQALSELFRVMKKNIRIVLLNACHAKRQADGITEVIDFTIGMNTAIGDKDAIIFASYFYQALAFGESVKDAFEMAKAQILIEGLSGFKTPALLVRQGVNASEAFLVEREVQSTESDRSQSSEDPQKRGSINITDTKMEGVSMIWGNSNTVKQSS